MEKFTPIAVLFILSLGLSAVSAQESASVSGIVTDANGAAVAGATVTIRKMAGAQIQSATTDTQGQYRFSNLIADQYVVEVTADKFQFVSKEARVKAGETQSHPASLRSHAGGRTKASSRFAGRVFATTSMCEG